MSRAPRPPKEAPSGSTGRRRRRDPSADGQAMEGSMRADPATRPHADVTDLNDDEFALLKQVFSQLDADGSGELSIRELNGVVIGNVMMDESVFKKIDKNRSGAVSVEEIVQFCYPRVPKRRIQMYFAKVIPADVFLQVKLAFAEMATKGKLTESKLRDVGEQVGGHRFTVETFRKYAQGRPGLSFYEVINTLFPCLRPDLVERYMATRLLVEEFLALKLYFNILDKDAKGFVTQRDFNRVQQSGDKGLSDDLKATFNRMVGGTKFDMQTFNRVDKEKTGKINFVQYLRSFFPSLSDRIIKVYWDYYTPERLIEHREHRLVIEQEEEKRREKLLYEGEKRFKKLMSQFQQSMPTNQLLDNAGTDAGHGYETRPSTASSSIDDREEVLFVNEAMRQQREKERKDRAQMEGMEDSDRWLMVVEEHRERLKVSDLQNVSLRKVRESIHMQQCLMDQQQIAEKELQMKAKKPRAAAQQQ